MKCLLFRREWQGWEIPFFEEKGRIEKSKGHHPLVLGLTNNMKLLHETSPRHWTNCQENLQEQEINTTFARANLLLSNDNIEYNNKYYCHKISAFSK